MKLLAERCAGRMWWVHLGWLPDTHPDTLTLFPQQNGGENEMEKLMAWVRKPKTVQGSKTKREIYSLFPISRYFLGSRASVHIAIAWEYKHHNHDVSSFFPLSLPLLLNTTSCSMGYSFGHFSLPASCPLPAWSFLGWEDWQDSLDAVQSLLSSSQNTGVSSVRFWPQTQSPAPHRLVWRKLAAPQSDPERI